MFQIQTIDRVKNKPPLLPKIFLVQVKSNSIFSSYEGSHDNLSMRSNI